MQPQAKGTQRQAHFRSNVQPHPQNGSAQPQTGLGMLMSNSAPAPAPVTYATHLTPDQNARYQADLADREHQASSLAAAGLVADQNVGGMRAPPALVGMPMNSMPVPSMNDGQGMPPGNNGAPQVESINWNLDGDTSGATMNTGLDDIDMDFAVLFDNEEQLLDTAVP